MTSSLSLASVSPVCPPPTPIMASSSEDTRNRAGKSSSHNLYRPALICYLIFRLEALDTNGVPFVGCIKDIVIERQVLKIEQSMLRGDVHSHVCPTI